MTSPRLLRRMAGFSLIEFLMTAVILGVGLLGLAALTTTAMRGYGEGRTRVTAVSLSSSILDRLALDGRISAQMRSSGGTVPASALVANAVDDAVNTYADPATTWTTFDLEGQPSQTAPVFTATWIRRTAKGPAPAASSLFAASEVVVNLQWNEAIKNATTGVTTTTPRYISTSRSIRY